AGVGRDGGRDGGALRAAPLVPDARDAQRRERAPFGGQGPVHLDALRVVHHLVRAVVAERQHREVPGRPALADRRDERRQHREREALAVLGGELELVRADAERVEDHLVGAPDQLEGSHFAADPGEVHRHRAQLLRGRTKGSTTFSLTGSSTTSTGRSSANISGVISRIPVTMRTPSSSSVTATAYGTSRANAGCSA